MTAAAPADREAGALLHELLDGYTSPASVDDEVRELRRDLGEARQETAELENQIATAKRRVVDALTLLARVREVCADECKLDEAITLLEETDLD
jgi:Mg2+ and Co2+ transporter CorA